MFCPFSCLDGNRTHRFVNTRTLLGNVIRNWPNFGYLSPAHLRHHYLSCYEIVRTHLPVTSEGVIRWVVVMVTTERSEWGASDVSQFPVF